MNNQRKIYFLLMIGVAAALALLAACQPKERATQPSNADKWGKQVDTGKGTYIDLTPLEFQKVIERKDEVLLVNVHIPFQGDIPGTHLSIPYDKIDQNLGQLPEDKNAEIAIYCSSGYMSGIAAEKLVDLGYTNISNLSGGMQAWQQAGLPIEK